MVIFPVLLHHYTLTTMARTRASDFEEKRLNLLENAAAAFAEMGMEKTSMARIAERCGVSKALLYHYYPSKDALIFDIVRTHLVELDKALEIIAAQTQNQPPRERLRQMVQAILHCYEHADSKHKVQLSCTGSLQPAQTTILRDIERSIVHRLTAILQEINPHLAHSQKHLMKPVTMTLFGMLNWVYMWFRTDGPITRDDYANLATTILLDGIKEYTGTPSVLVKK